jgi:hypothetical protein
MYQNNVNSGNDYGSGSEMKIYPGMNQPSNYNTIPKRRTNHQVGDLNTLQNANRLETSLPSTNPLREFPDLVDISISHN